MTDYPMPTHPIGHPDDSAPMPAYSGFVPLPSGNCGRPLANTCGWGFPPNCATHGVRSPMPTPSPTFVGNEFSSDAGPGGEDPPGSGVYRSSVSDGRTPVDKPTAAIDPARALFPPNSVNDSAQAFGDALSRPDPAYDPRTVKTSHPDGAASWGQVLTWAVHADHIAAPDEAGTLWCAAGADCSYPRWSRFNPSTPGDPDRPVSELFCWLAEHWGCRRV